MGSVPRKHEGNTQDLEHDIPREDDKNVSELMPFLTKGSRGEWR